MAKGTKKAESNANLGFEAKLWLAADKLRNNMDAAEYKHVILGLIFLKYISDTFDEHHAKLVAGAVAESGDFAGANPEDKDEYLAGFCKSATTLEVAAHGFVLTPGRYVGAEEVADDGEPFEKKMPRLVKELHAQFDESAKLEDQIKRNLEGLGYGL